MYLSLVVKFLGDKLTIYLCKVHTIKLSSDNGTISIAVYQQEAEAEERGRGRERRPEADRPHKGVPEHLSPCQNP